jgi:hypothetical protein
VRSTEIKFIELEAGQTVVSGGIAMLDGSKGLAQPTIEVCDRPHAGSVNPLNGPEEKVIGELELINRLVNEEAFKAMRFRNSCILSSFALQHVLTELGYPNVTPVRVIGYLGSKDSITVLGERPEGVAQPKRRRGLWSGHLVVVVDDCFLLDPTLDQVKRKGLMPKPCVLKIPPAFSDCTGNSASLSDGDWSVCYEAHNRQEGFRDAPAAKPKCWKPIATAVLSAYTSHQKDATKPVSGRENMMDPEQVTLRIWHYHSEILPSGSLKSNPRTQESTALSATG